MSTGARSVRLVVAYDGTDFRGWQYQPGARTVQGELEAVLARLQAERPARVRGAGRTDAGVHAEAQVADARVTWDGDDDALAYALRRMLPPDLRPVAIDTVPDDFDARRNARWKTYRYTLDLSRHGNPFRQRYCLHVPHRLDLARLERGLAALPGRHDWSGFVAASCTIENRVRTMRVATCHGADDRVELRFTADGFLTYMVRNIAGTLIEIARGRMPGSRIEEILACRERAAAGPTAPARGLCLESIAYEEEPTP